MHPGQSMRVTILELSGPFDDWDLAPLRTVIEKPLKSGCRRFVLNLRGVQDVSDAILGYVLKTRRECADAGGELVLSEPSAVARALIGRHDLLSQVPTFTGNQAALRHLYGGGGLR